MSYQKATVNSSLAIIKSTQEPIFFLLGFMATRHISIHCSNITFKVPLLVTIASFLLYGTKLQQTRLIVNESGRWSSNEWWICHLMSA